MKRLLLVGAPGDVIEARKVLLESAGFVVTLLARGEPVRKAAEGIGAALVVIDVASGGPDVRAALDEMSAEAGPSDIPLLVLGPEETLSDFDGPGAALPKPADKRRLLSSARALVDGGRRSWSRRTRR